jgi:hypothetical protein
LVSVGFVVGKSNTLLFISHLGTDSTYLLLHIDDIVLIASRPKLLQRITTTLQCEFAMKDLGSLHHFLSVLVEKRPDDLFLHQC